MVVLGRVGNAIFDFIYPPVCSTCDRVLDRGENYVCGRCWSDFERVPATETFTQLIEQKFLANEAIDGLTSVFLFEQDRRVREAVHLLKYAGAEAIGRTFGKMIARVVAVNEKLAACEAVAPVPLHPSRRRERGYNQSELITMSICAELEVRHLPGLLIRKRQTQTQTLLDAEGRRKNISGAFAIGKDFGGSIEGMRVLLVDDVITTGSTIKECARVLKENGALEVYAASAAITV